MSSFRYLNKGRPLSFDTFSFVPSEDRSPEKKDKNELARESTKGERPHNNYQRG